MLIRMCSPVSLFCKLVSSALLTLVWFYLDTAKESAHPGVKAPTFDWRKISPQTYLCEIGITFGHSV